jgi:hypothetical protein
VVALDNLAKQLELHVARVLEFVGHDKSIRVLHHAKRSPLGFKQAQWQRQHQRVIDCAALLKKRLVGNTQWQKKFVVNVFGLIHTPTLVTQTQAKPIEGERQLRE